MLARAPASSANLGPGFDAVALALSLHVEVEVTDAQTLSVRLEGEGAGLRADATNLAARVAIEVCGHDHLSVTVRSSIPPSRGLGSSAAVALAAAAAAGSDDPLGVAARVEGHPENAAASFKGGLVAATTEGDEIVVASLGLDPTLVVVVCVPDLELSTPAARAALPQTYERADVVFNLQRLGLLLAGLADLDQLSATATEDRVHERFRAPLFPGAAGLAAAMREGGALGACWSGAGPSVLGVARSGSAGAVADAARRAMRDAAVGGAVVKLVPDLVGLDWG